MVKQTKLSPKVTEKSTKSEILDAYHELMEQATIGAVANEIVKEEETVKISAAKETVEKVTTDLSQLRISANQTISSLTEQLTAEAERFSTLQKAIAFAQKELEEINQIKVQAGMLKRMIELQKIEEEQFEKEKAETRAAWADEQMSYEERLKKERSREDEEYAYEKKLRLKREKDSFDEEKRAWERDLQEKKQLQSQQEAELTDLRKKALQFPVELEKAVKVAVTDAISQEKKESQIRQNFAKQEWDGKQQISILKISSLEQTVKAQTAEIEELKRQLEKATQQIKDIAVKVIEGSKRESDLPAKTSSQNLA